MNCFTSYLLAIACFAIVLCNSANIPLKKNTPSPDQIPEMARYIIHNTDWISVASISTLPNITGYPFVTLKSFVDGPVNGSTGVPYLYMTDMDVSAIDFLDNNVVTILSSLAESIDGCLIEDPQDPLCPKVMISGKYVKLDADSDEYKFGKDALYARHPEMELWPEEHGFYVAKIDIEQIAVIDFFGGVQYATVDDYFAVNNVTYTSRD